MKWIDRSKSSVFSVWGGDDCLQTEVEKPSAKIVFSCFPNEFIKILCHGSEVTELSYLLVSEQDISLP